MGRRRAGTGRRRAGRGAAVVGASAYHLGHTFLRAGRIREATDLIKRARLFVWLREYRRELFDEDFQAELAGMYQDKPEGQPPVPPAELGLATILQADTGASDDEVIEACVMDRRWQLVLDCMDHAQAPLSKTTLGWRFVPGWSSATWTGGWWSTRQACMGS